MNDGVAIGIDVGGTKLEALVLADGRERWRRRVPTPAGDYDGTVRAIAGLVAAARSELQFATCTIGCGTPGSVTAAGTMKNCNSTCLNGRPLPRDLAGVLGQPIRIANDANCLALSEATDGAGAGAEVVFAAILGTGVGGGIAVRGQVLTGPNGLAGEWGHVPLPWRTDADPEWPCYCGQRGCLETLLSGPSLARDHSCHGAGDAAAIAAAAAGGDPAALATLDRYCDRLARACAQLVNLLDPDVIVLGGGVSKIAALYESAAALLPRHVFAASATDPVRTRLLPALHGDSSGVRGAAWLGASGACARP
ncbi:MAG: ROK family protein [Planctomycetes bacterium]|nr:ROK family protein [Planctomycetota bacterium]